MIDLVEGGRSCGVLPGREARFQQKGPLRCRRGPHGYLLLSLLCVQPTAQAQRSRYYLYIPFCVHLQNRPGTRRSHPTSASTCPVVVVVGAVSTPGGRDPKVAHSPHHYSMLPVLLYLHLEQAEEVATGVVVVVASELEG